MTAAVVIVTHERTGGMHKLKYAFTTDSSSGSATGTSIEPFTGVITRVVVDPASSGSPSQLSNGYGITLKDQDGYDLLGNSGSALTSGGSALASDITQFKEDEIPGSINNDLIEMSVTSAGNSKSGTVILYIESNEYP